MRRAKPRFEKGRRALEKGSGVPGKGKLQEPPADAGRVALRFPMRRGEGEGREELYVH